MAKIVLEQTDIEQLEKIIIEMPFKYAQPLLNFLQSKVTQHEKNEESETKK